MTQSVVQGTQSGTTKAYITHQQPVVPEDHDSILEYRGSDEEKEVDKSKIYDLYNTIKKLETQEHTEKFISIIKNNTGVFSDGISFSDWLNVANIQGWNNRGEKNKNQFLEFIIDDLKAFFELYPELSFLSLDKVDFNNIRGFEGIL